MPLAIVDKPCPARVCQRKDNFMIRISKLRLRNFKSFKKAELPFSNGFTAIVGSNGSGKSNLCDALLFVLGISSMKALRAGKMVDLITHGADSDYATAEAEFKDGQKNYVFSRSIDRHGKSIVRLDGKRIGLNEAQSLLEELGVKATGHNIVLQGDVTRIIEMNDIQRREIIDDMAGLKEFDEKKAEALKELEKVDSKIKEARIVLAERSIYLEELNKERNSAMEFNSLNEELKQSKAGLLKNEIEKIESGLKQNSEKTKKIAWEKLEKQKRLGEARQELEELEKEIEILNQKIIHSKEKAFSSIGIDAEEKKAIRKIREEREIAKNEAIEKNKKKIIELNEKNRVLEKEQCEKAGEIAIKETELKALEKELHALDEQSSVLAEKLKEKDSGLKIVENGIKSLREEIGAEREKFFGKKSELQSLAGFIEANSKALSGLESELKELEKKERYFLEKNDLLKAITAKHPDIEKELAHAEKALDEANAKASYAESSADSLSESIGRLSKAIASCPVCDSKLSADKKRSLLAKKQEELKKLNQERQEALKAIDAKRALKKELEKSISESSVLSAELKGFDELKLKKKALVSKTRELREAIEKNNSKSIEASIKESEEAIAVLEQKLEEKEKALSLEKQKTGLSALHELNEKTGKAMQKRNDVREKKNSLELEANKLIIEERESNLGEIRALEKENSGLEAFIAAERKEIVLLEVKIKELEIELAKTEKESNAIILEKEKKTQKTILIKEKISKADYSLRDSERQENEINIENSKLEVRLVDLQQEFAGFVGVLALKEFDAAKIRKRIPEIEHRIKELGAINLKALEHFGSFEKELLEIKSKSEKLEQERLAVLEMINKIEIRRTEVFLDCFNAINRNFNKIFFELSDGQGKLNLTDSEKPLESGLLIEASFKGKEIKNIDLMSGGEKTLTALAFLFALQLYEPAPFYLFDEADAALDKENSVKFVRIIKNISKTSQFIAITHNDTVIKEADQIVGVALSKDKSSVIGLRLKEEIEENINNGQLTKTIA